MKAHLLVTLFRRRNLSAALVAVLSSVVFVCGLGYSRAQGPAKEEREVEDRIPKHLPIKVKVKNQEKVKDLKNENWPGDLEVEVTNTGSKPIYYLSIAISLPGVVSEDGKEIGYKVRHGRIYLADFREPILSDDVPIRSGESVSLKIPVKQVEAWKYFRAKGKLSNPQKILFIFQEINFGDGTGFWTADGIPMPRGKERSANATCGDKDIQGYSGLIAASVQPKPPLEVAFLQASLSLPAGHLPAEFFTGKFTTAPLPKRDICCNVSRIDCSFMIPGGVTCICGEAERAQGASCSDPYGACTTVIYKQTPCTDSTGFTHYCEESTLGGSCASPTPPPPPETPPPTPPPTGEPTPNRPPPNTTNCYWDKYPGTQIWDWMCFCAEGTPADYPHNGATGRAAYS